MSLTPCPHCGKLDDVYINVQASGWAQHYYAVHTGLPEHFVIDQLRYKDSAIVRCASCGQRRRDLMVRNGAIVIGGTADG